MARHTPLGKRVIDAFGGPVRMARAMGWPISTIDSWKDKDSIPRWRLRDIRSVAQAEKVVLPDDFPVAADVPRLGRAKKANARGQAASARSRATRLGSKRDSASAAEEASVSFVRKIGDHYALLMSRSMVERAGLGEGSRVEIEPTEDGRLVVSRSKRHFTLDELLAGMTPEREHPLEDDAPRGEETL
jgi:antitoxin MazE